ncbi:site-2 protease family protein [Candidatus Falkowbacteria bacterium CG10_big_fil_rev_8_21_14_0_10_38_22]|uniref:Site-2 protease family protein n=1 Tax=Candidatus Falkowbacteria bacterium CG10_big_fil_rev_8_21_14_0_10_38_22 TaxID=1974564 RepID=A0A2M6WRZ2_9BACT|nr:MAG: site-2 protease family protein [Candidatus Falkowbacteria bacterium CG10_big_fil_rev_8_21_14_0_10_38_22]
MIFALIIILFSAVIHEYMHGWTADRLGDPTAKDAGRLTLNPMAHIDWWGSILMPALIYFATGGGLIFGYAKPVPFNPYNLRDQKYGVAKVAIAGPLANFLVALSFGLLLRFSPAINTNLALFIATIVQINLVLMIFNLLPIPPLDGSKVIAPFLPYRWQEKLNRLEQYGMLIVLFVVLFGFSLIIPIINSLFKLIVGS